MQCFFFASKNLKKKTIPWEPVPSTKNQRKHRHSEINKMGHILKNLGRIRLHHHRIYVEIFCLICLITTFNFAMDGHGLFGQFTRFLRFNRVPLSHDDIPPSTTTFCNHTSTLLKANVSSIKNTVVIAVIPKT